MGRYTGKTCRLLCMLALTGSFFLVEIITGYVTNSLALVGDAYHMLSDVVALLVGFASVRISKWQSKKNTFGWARAEVLGALVNSVFLIALCFTIFTEAVQRLAETEKIHNVDLLMIVGGVGLLVNIIGLFLFAGHGHSHGGGSHSHGHGHGHGHSHSPKKGERNNISEENDETGPLRQEPNIKRLSNGSIQVSTDGQGLDIENVVISGIREDTDGITVQNKTASAAQMNMRGVFLHVLGDALGSVVVIISGLCIKYVEADWKYKLDPIMSILLVVIILITTIPLLKESSLILLQTVPSHIEVTEIQEKLLTEVEGISAVHEFHVWQLTGNRIIATAHIRCQNIREYMKIAAQCKHFFHNEGIHSTTIQPEFIDNDSNTLSTKSSVNTCLLDCPDCQVDQCCQTDNSFTRADVGSSRRGSGASKGSDKSNRSKKSRKKSSSNSLLRTIFTGLSPNDPSATSSNVDRPKAPDSGGSYRSVNTQ